MDRFLLVMLHLVCVVLSLPAGKGLISWLSCVLCFLVFCHFPKCVLVLTRIKGKVGALQ